MEGDRFIKHDRDKKAGSCHSSRGVHSSQSIWICRACMWKGKAAQKSEESAQKSSMPGNITNTGASTIVLERKYMERNLWKYT